MRKPALLITSLALAALTSAGARAEDPTFRIEFKDGVVTPQRVEAPAKVRIVLELVNTGSTPAEFESKELRKEKVVAPGTSSTLVLRSLDPGEYQFVDDFHPEAPPAILVAR